MQDIALNAIRGTSTSTRQYKQLAALWALRALVHARGYEQIMHSSGFHDDATLRAIGLVHLVDKDMSRTQGYRALKKRLSEVEQNNPTLSAGPLFDNLEWLGKALRLNKTEKAILALLAISYSHGVLYESLDNTGDMIRERLIEVFAMVLGVARRHVAKAFDPESMLVASGIIRLEGRNRYNFRNAIEVIEGFLDTILRAHRDPSRLLDAYFFRSESTALNTNDFDYLADDIRIITRYLKQARKQKRQKGVNILLHGRPGAGKTVLARVIAEAVGLDLYEITMTLEQGDAVKGEKRFSIYQLAQQLLARKRQSIVLFDEVEDVFPEPTYWFFGSRSSNDGQKAWINRQLEQNPVPTIWISNSADHIDPAFLRRFDYILELKTPVRSVRHRMLREALRDVDVDEAWIARMAANDNLVPAHIERASRVLRQVKPETPAQAEQVLERAIGNTLRAMGETANFINASGSSTPYSTALLNPSEDLDALAWGLRQGRPARLCFYGPPGTGKTAFAEHLARLLDRPILKKRASDIFSKWVGESEKNIAGMFSEAREEDAILFLDEADSFLQDRKQANASWEISQVNELLVQMEQFNGVFIAATNLMDTLDAASLRRFDLKVYFDYLNADQAVELLSQMLSVNSLSDRAGLRARFSGLENLALGDFAAVSRRAALLGDHWHAARWVDALERECAAKPDARRAIMGFVSPIARRGEQPDEQGAAQ